jgi:hypothetical protein
MRHGQSTTSASHPISGIPAAATCPTPGANCPAVGGSGGSGPGQRINAGQARGFRGSRGHGQAQACLAAVPAGSVSTLSAEHLTAAIDEERVAHDLYAAAASKTGLATFTHIAAAEMRHADALTHLAGTAGVTPHAATPGTYANPDMQHLYDSLLPMMTESETSALKAGALIEESDIADLRRLLASDCDPATKAVLGNLAIASERHFAAFVRNLSARGVAYTPQVLSATDYAAIIGG